MSDKLSLEAFEGKIGDNPVALARFAAILLKKGKKDEAYGLALRAIKLKPHDPDVRSMACSVLSSDVPDWHFGIVRDQERNDAYEAALKRAVTPQSKVFEVGTGTGILAMMAARAGAREVVTCEMNRAVADAATDVVAANGYAERVRVLNRKSQDLDAGADLDGRADIFVSELVDNMLLGEHMLEVTEHAVRDLLNPGARVIPARGFVRVALAYDTLIGKKRMTTASGFDLSPFNRLAANFYRVERGSEQLSLQSQPADLFTFDFQSGGPFPPGSASVTLTSTGGKTNGIVQWIALQMDETGWYENAPKPGASSAWAVLFRPFPNERVYVDGDKVEVFGTHDRVRVRIWA